MQPSGANKNKDDQAIFSNEGPNLIRPALTNKPRVTPKIYKLKNKRRRGNLWRLPLYGLPDGSKSY